jgi:tetratricopeptide (TPR) repeat protein
MIQDERSSEPRPRASRRGSGNGFPARRFIALSAGLSAVVLLAFLPVLFNGYVEIFDDGVNFLKNPYFRGFGWNEWVWAWTTAVAGVYQPLGWMVLELEYLGWGLEPWGYHLVSIVFHGLNVIALFALTVVLLDRIAPEEGDRQWKMTCAAIASAWFAVHPLRVEAVAWASCQTYLPGMLFMELAVLAYLAANPGAGSRRTGWLIAAWGLLLVGLLFKAVGFTVPAIMIILDVYPLRRLGGSRERWFGPAARRVWWEKVPFGALSLVFVVLAYLARRRGVKLTALPDGPAERLTQATYAVCFYPVKTLWPSGVTGVYPLPEQPHALEPLFLASALAVLAVSVAVVLFRRRWPGLAAAWAIYLVTIAPNSGLMRVSDHVAANRYAYVPSMVLTVLTAYLLVRAGRGARSRGWIVAAGVVPGAVLLVPTWAQCRAWQNDATFFASVVADRPDDPRPRLALGAALEGEKKFGEAEAQYNRARQLGPQLPHPLNNLGLLRIREKKYDEARACFAEAMRIAPDFAETYTNMGLLCAYQGRWSEAVAWHEKALARHQKESWVDMREPASHQFLAEALEHEGRYNEALSHYEAAVELDPSDPLAQQAYHEFMRRRSESLSMPFRAMP